MNTFRALGALTVLLAGSAWSTDEIPAEAPTIEVPTIEVPTIEVSTIDAPPVEAPPAADTSRLEAFVDGVVQTQIREHGLPAITLAVVREDRLDLARGWGLADIAEGLPVDPDQTRFRIGSISKTFTWTAVMLLVERGLLDLDADVNGYLSDWQIEPAFGQPVTLRHILHHRAGFEDSMRLFAVADDDPRALSELLAEHQPRRVYPPGARTSYSNWASALAALLVAKASGEDYGVFLRRELLDPLAMHATDWDSPRALPEPEQARLARGYRAARGALEAQGYMQLGAYWPAGGMASTATDMARWMRFHLNGGEVDGVRLMRADTHAAMWTRAFPDRPEAADLAHGFIDRPYRGLRTVGHAGGTAAFLSNMVMVPELGLGVFHSQSSTASAAPLLHLVDLIIDHEMDRPAFTPLLAEESDSEALADLAGSYLSNRRVFSSMAAILSLAGVTTVSVVSDNAIRIASGLDSGLFRRLEGQAEVFENARGARIAVIRDDSGAVLALADSVGVHTLERLARHRHPTLFGLLMALAAVLAFTTLLAAWRRRGGRVRRWHSAGLVSALCALAVIGLVVAVLRLIIGLSDFDLAELAGQYPPAAMIHLHYAGWLLTALSGLLLLTLLPLWRGSSWSFGRRAHVSLFALVLLALVFQLWQWRIIGAPVY